MSSWLYESIVVAHILCAIVGLGGVTLNGLYAAQARKRRGPEGVAIMEANLAVTQVAEILILFVLVTGLILVAVNSEGFTFGQTWVWLSIGLFVVALVLTYAVMQPAGKRMLALAKEPGPPSPERQAALGRLGRQLSTVGPILQVLLLAVLVLMVFKPGFIEG